MVFPLLILADRAFRKYGWLAQLIIWVAFDVVRTKGFIGYSYGVIGYSQYGWRSLISIADIFGVMGVSMLVAFPSFLIGAYLLDCGFGSVNNGLERFPWLEKTRTPIHCPCRSLGGFDAGGQRLRNRCPGWITQKAGSGGPH